MENLIIGELIPSAEDKITHIRDAKKGSNDDSNFLRGDREGRLYFNSSDLSISVFDDGAIPRDSLSMELHWL
jgi:hypothetical protein